MNEPTTTDTTTVDTTTADEDVFAAAFAPAKPPTDTTALPEADTDDPASHVPDTDNLDDPRTPGDPDDGDGDGDGSGNREAAKYRRRLRDTEAERDALQARLDVVQRGEVERLVTDRLRDPSDIWRDGAQLSEMLDEAGNVDPAKVAALAGKVLKAHAHWGIQTPPSRQYGSPVSGASAPARTQRDAFTQAFAPREH